MKFHTVMIAFLMSLAIATVGWSQATPKERGADRKQGSKTLNEIATSMPAPAYPMDARNLCVRGKVEVEVRIGNDGKVISAVAVSGHELLREPSVKAAKKATFPPVSFSTPVIAKGMLVYDFDRVPKCRVVGVVNKKARSIPKPILGSNMVSSHVGLKNGDTVNVAIVIDENGDVVSANAISGHVLFRRAFERSAAGAKFFPTPIGQIRIKAILSYTIKPNGEIVY